MPATCKSNAEESAEVATLGVDRFEQVNTAANDATSNFIESAVGGHADRGRLGARALLYLRRQRVLKPAVGKEAVAELRNLATVSAMCGWRRAALGYAKELVALPACAADAGCFCGTVGRIINLQRSEVSASAADEYFDAHARERCPYVSSWQMPAPPEGYEASLQAKPFWDPNAFAAGRLLRRHGAAMLRELRPFMRLRDAKDSQQPLKSLWSKDTESVAYELIESGSWRQLALYQAHEKTSPWHKLVCAEHLALTCATLQAFAASSDGQRELGGKVKLFELGPGASLMPHFGTTNRRLFLHMAVSLPTATDGHASLRVAAETRNWTAVGELMLFDDSFEHAVLNTATAARRVVLGVELNHPRGSGLVGLWDSASGQKWS